MKVGTLLAILGASVAVAVLAVSGCALDGSQKAAAEATAGVTERDFHISAPAQLPAGEVDFAVTNRGPDAHEFIVVRKAADRPRLPLRADGLTVNEEKIAHREVGSLEPSDPTTRHLTVDLKPGTYEMFCNMDGHYMAGMHHQFVVR